MIPMPSVELLEYLIGIRIDTTRNGAVLYPISETRIVRLSGGVYFANLNRAPYLDINDAARAILNQAKVLDSETADPLGINWKNFRCVGPYKAKPASVSVIRGQIDMLFDLDYQEGAALCTLARWALRIAIQIARAEGLALVPSLLFFSALICFDSMSLHIPDPIVVYGDGNLWQDANYRLHKTRSSLLELVNLSNPTRETPLDLNRDREEEILKILLDGEPLELGHDNDEALNSFTAFRSKMVSEWEEWMNDNDFYTVGIFSDEYDMEYAVPLLLKRELLLRVSTRSSGRIVDNQTSATVYARDLPRIREVVPQK